jgi:hypothetical protein
VGHGSGSHILVPAPNVINITKGGQETLQWKHKECNYKFWQEKNKGGLKTWNTGTFGKKLEVVAKGKKRAFLRKAKWSRRAEYVLAMRLKTDAIAMPLKGMKFFPFEEDIMHQIDEALVICSTGIGMSFFGNAFVRDWLHNLQPRFRPIYRLKLTRVIRCIQDVLQSEVSRFFCLHSLFLISIFSYNSYNNCVPFSDPYLCYRIFHSIWKQLCFIDI